MVFEALWVHNLWYVLHYGTYCLVAGGFQPLFSQAGCQSAAVGACGLDDNPSSSHHFNTQSWSNLDDLG